MRPFALISLNILCELGEDDHLVLWNHMLSKLFNDLLGICCCFLCILCPQQDLDHFPLHLFCDDAPIPPDSLKPFDNDPVFLIEQGILLLCPPLISPCWDKQGSLEIAFILKLHDSWKRLIDLPDKAKSILSLLFLKPDKDGISIRIDDLKACRLSLLDDHRDIMPAISSNTPPNIKIVESCLDKAKIAIK